MQYTRHAMHHPSGLGQVVVELVAPPHGEALVLGGVGALGREARHARRGDAERLEVRTHVRK